MRNRRFTTTDEDEIEMIYSLAGHRRNRGRVGLGTGSPDVSLTREPMKAPLPW